MIKNYNKKDILWITFFLNLMQKIIKKILFIHYIALIAFFVFFSFSNASSLKLNPLKRNYYKNAVSWYNIDLYIDTQDFSIYSLDFKFFLSWFTYQTFDLHSDFINDWRTYNFLTWRATLWTNLWRNYYYINAYKLNTSQLNSYNNVRLWTLTLKYLSWYQYKTWYVDFYYLWPSINSDDSNIASWIDNDTKYVDVLDIVSWWVYTFIGEIPWINSWYYSQQTFQDSWSDYKIIFKNILAWYLFNSPNDYVWNNWTNSTWRDTRTNTAVVLNLIFDKDIKILTWFNQYSDGTITIENNDLPSSRRTLTIHNNISTWILFESYWDIWSWYVYLSGTNHYTWKFWIDVFWIDKEATYLTWFLSWNIYSLKTDLYLSWYNSWSAKRNTKDDEYKIINFSWTQNAPTNYLSSANNLFQMNHLLEFIKERSGYIFYIDRAWNTWYYRANIPPKIFYPIKIRPQNRGKRWSDFVYSTNWILIVHDEWQTWILATWRVETEGSWYWWAFFSWFELSWIYDLDFQWVWSHIQYLTWVSVYNTQTLIDFTSWAKRNLIWYIKWDSITYHNTYQNISWSPVSNFQISFNPIFNFETTLFASQNLIISNDDWSLDTSLNKYLRNIPSIVAPSQTWYVYMRWEILNPITSIKSFWFTSNNWNIQIIDSWSFVSTQLIAWDLPNWDQVRDQCINMLDSAQISSIMFNSSNPKPFNYIYPATDFNWDWQTTVTDFALYLINQFRWDGCMWGLNSISY